MTTAFHGDPAMKAAALARLDRHFAAGTLVVGETGWDGERGGPLGILGETADLDEAARRLGYPLALAGLLDPLAALLGADEAAAFARDWIARATPGADLSPVPARIVLALLDRFAEGVAAEVRALHRRDLDGDAVSRAEWGSARATLLRAADEDRDPATRAALALAEAAAWPASASRSILIDMVTAARALIPLEPDPDWSPADRDRAQAMLEALWEEQRSAREAGERVFYPTLFAARDPDLAARFEANLVRVNARSLALIDGLRATVLEQLSAS